MNLEQILEEITQGLTGDAQADIAYLREQADTYSDHTDAADIKNACERMIMERLPEEQRREALETIQTKHVLPLQQGLEQARALIKAGNDNDALAALQTLAEQADTAAERGLFQNDVLTEYYCFGEPFEEILYMMRKKPEREVRHADIPYADIYHLYGRLLMQQGDHQTATDILKKAQRYNPAACAIGFDLADSQKATGDIEDFMETTRKIFPYAYRAKDLAHCYTNVGQYFMAQEQWSEAKGCILFGQQFDDTDPQAQADLDTIERTTNGEAINPAIEIMEALSAIHDFPLGADSTIVGFAYNYGLSFMKQHNTDAARYFLTIAYELTKGEEVKLMLENL